jgi:Flp pilus assembly protein protease CpaA
VTQAALSPPPKRRPGRAPEDRRRAWIAALVVPLVLGPAWAAALGRWPALGSVSGLVLLLLLAASTITDLRRRRIPNWATYPALAWALALNGLVSLAGLVAPPDVADSVQGALSAGLEGFGESVTGAAACFIPMVIIYGIAGGGAGDVKLATAIGALVGPRLGVMILISSYIVAGVNAAGLAIWKVGPGTLAAGLARSIGSAVWPHRIGRPSPGQERILREPIPLAASFAAGTAVTLWWAYFR